MSTSASGPLARGPQPKHRRLRELLIEMVVPGQAIPSERELMAAYGVSRATVRKAIDGLVADGLLQRTQGLGTFAVRPRVESRLHLASFTQDMLRRGRTPSTRLISAGRAEPPAEIAAWLGLEAGRWAWEIVRVRSADGHPIAHEDGWYHPAHFPDLDQQPISTGSLYSIFAEHYGILVDHAEQTMWAETADAGMAMVLSAPVGAALLVFRRRSSSAGRPVEYVTSRYRGDRYQVHMELSRQESVRAVEDPSADE